MALTKITGQVVDTTTDLVVGVTTVGGGVSAVDGFFSGIVTFSQGVSIGGTLTYEDVTNIDSVGIITARSDILVGSGITLSPDGDGFYTGIVTATSVDINGGNLTIGDGGGDPSVNRLTFGEGNDLTIFHAPEISYIQESGSGNLKILASDLILGDENGTEFFRGYDNGQVELSHNGTKKLATAATGINPSADSTDDIGTNTIRWRNVYADTLYGDGSNLSGISVGITTEAYVVQAVSGITTFLDLSKDDHKITASGITTVDVRGGTEASSHTLRIENSGITTVGFSTYFLFPSGGTPNLPTTDGAISLISFTVHRAGAVGLATQLLAGASVNFS